MNGQMSDKSQMVNAFKTGQSKLTSDDLSDLKVRVYGNTAVITGKADVKGTLAGNDATGQIMFTRVYVKKGRSLAVRCVSANPRLEPLTEKRIGPGASALGQFSGKFDAPPLYIMTAPIASSNPALHRIFKIISASSAKAKTLCRTARPMRHYSRPGQTYGPGYAACAIP